MLVYSLLLITSFITAARYCRREHIGCNYSLIFPGAILIALVVGLRDGGGVDYQSYVWMFKALGEEWYTTTKLEVGYYMLNLVVKRAGGGVEWVFFLALLITILPVAATLRRYSAYPEISFIVFFGSQLLFMLANLVRQGIAVGLCFYATRFIVERRLMFFFSLVAFASLFHFSAVLFLPAYFFAHRIINRGVLLVIFAISVAMMLDNTILISGMEVLDEWLYDGRYQHLLTGVLDTERELGRRLIVYNFILAFLIWQYRNLSATVEARVFTNLAIVGFVLLNATNGLPVLPRITHYFTFASFIAIPQVVSLFSDGRQKAVAHVAVTVVYGSLFVHALVTDGYEVLPYRHLWF